MGLMILAGAETSVVLALLLLGGLALTAWEAHDQRMDRKTAMWWILLLLLIHVVGYVAMRLVTASKPKGQAGES